MKKLASKGFYIFSVIILFIGATFPAWAQYTNTNLESGGLYTVLAKDRSNNLYVTRVTPSTTGTTYEVEKYINGTGTPVVIYTSLTHELGDYPWGLAVTSTGTVYISTDFTTGGGAIIKLTFNGGAGTYTISTFQTGRYFTALAVDASDNLYDTEYDVAHSTYAVVKYAANSAANSTGTNLYDNLKTAAGYAYPTGLAVAANGDVYVADAFSNTPSINDGGHVYKLTAASSYAAAIVSTGMYSSALTLDPSGDLFSSENSGSGYQLVKYPSGGGAASVVFTPLHTNGIYYPWGIAVINSSDIFVADGDDGTQGGEVIQLTSPKPGISYNGPQTYLIGTAISALSPTSSGVGAPGYNSPVIIGTGFHGPGGVAADASGNVYVADRLNNAVKKIPAGGGSPVIIGSGFNSPYGVAVDVSGNVYVADYGNSMVKEILVGGVTETIGSGFSFPTGVALDAAGNVYVADYGHSMVKKIPVGGGAPLTLGSGFSSPFGVSVDGLGNVYVADNGNNAVKKIPVVGGSPVTIGSGFVNPHGVAVDAVGNVYVADYGNNAIKEIPFGGGGPVILGSGFNQPVGVGVDGAGNIYVGDYVNSAVKQIKPKGGYYIGPFLPAGLSFATATGVISGTPTVVSPAINYTITAYNNFGGSPAAVSIKTTNLPGISYNGPQTYLIGTAISALSPTSSGVGAPGYNSPVIIGTGFHGPGGVAADASGNVYVADRLNNAVKKIPAGGGSPVIIGSGFNSPYGVAVDVSGNVYIADYGNSMVKEILVGGVTETIGSGFSFPTGVALDAAGNVYVADYGHSMVKKIPVGGGAPLTLGSGFSSPFGVSVDGLGNVYVADNGNNAVKKIPVVGGSPVTIGSGFVNPHGVAVDAVGNVYVADYGNNAIKEIPFGGGGPVILGSGFNQPVGVGVDGAGNIYVGDYVNSAVKQIKPKGGYYIGPFLPAGLSFATATGVISGTPTVVSPAINYTITAYNNFGGSPAAVSIKTTNLPGISYNGPQTYLIGTAISALSPTSSGVGAPGYNSPVIIGTGFHGPGGVAADASGNVYVADRLNNAVKKIPAGGGSPVIIGSGFNSPYGVAVDVSGNVYVADYGNSMVKEILVGGVTETIGSGFSFPTGVALDAAGNVYVADYGHSMVKKIPVGGGAPLTLGSGFSSPFGVSVDGLGNVYVADNGNNAVKKIPVVGGSPVTIGSGFVNPHGVAVDAVGNVYVADYGNNAIKEIPFGGGGPVILGSGFNQPVGVGVDGAGNIYVGDYVNSAVKQIKPKGGYYIGPFLPAGLSFATATGVISGTPTVVSPAINYTITAYNNFGGSPAAVSIKTVSNNANLANLTLSSGALAPPFAIGTTSYSASVSFDTKSVTVSPTTSYPTATVTVALNGGAPAAISGTTSAPLSLNVGVNTIATQVTAQDGITTKTYTITVTRAGSYDAFLSHIAISAGTLSPAGTNSYTASVSNTTTSVTVTPTASDPNATITVAVNGGGPAAVTSGTSSGSLALNVGQNTITIIVTAQNGTTTQTYTITVTRASGTLLSLYRPISVVQPTDGLSVESDGILVHQGVSPNGDGVNDFLLIDGLIAYPENKLTIIDRSGAIIFEAKGYNNISKVFDGHSNIDGKMQQPGTYFYSLDYSVNGQSRNKTGYIILKY